MIVPTTSGLCRHEGCVYLLEIITCRRQRHLELGPKDLSYNLKSWRFTNFREAKRECSVKIKDVLFQKNKNLRKHFLTFGVSTYTAFVQLETAYSNMRGNSIYGCTLIYERLSIRGFLLMNELMKLLDRNASVRCYRAPPRQLGRSCDGDLGKLHAAGHILPLPLFV